MPAEEKRLLTSAEIRNLFFHGRCRCGSGKWEKQAFCDDCYSELSLKTRKGLRSRFGSGFEMFFRRACAEIDGEDQ